MSEEKKINLLIADDEKDFLDLMKKRLEMRDFNVIAVDRGDKAVEVARRQKIEIALLDLKMPGMDGEATLEALKNEHPLMEIVILTGHGSMDSAIQLSKTGAYYYLQKPCDLEKIIEVLVEAYKKYIQNKQKLKQEKIDEILRKVNSESPLTILHKLRELDSVS